MPNLLLQLFRPYLTPIEADEIRSEIAALNPRLHLVMPEWPWLEVRGLTVLRSDALVKRLKDRGLKFHVIGEKRERTREAACA